MCLDAVPTLTPRTTKGTSSQSNENKVNINIPIIEYGFMGATFWLGAMDSPRLACDGKSPCCVVVSVKISLPSTSLSAQKVKRLPHCHGALGTKHYKQNSTQRKRKVKCYSEQTERLRRYMQEYCGVLAPPLTASRTLAT
jgi:hypothetical protein